MNKLFILSGASGAGKSTLLSRLVLDGYCVAAPKYSDREKFDTADDIVTVENVDAPELQCDLIYSMYGNKYGFSSKLLKEGLINSNQILVSNDKNIIEKIKNFFPNQVVVTYIVSDINIDILKQIYMKRYGYPSIIGKEGALLKSIHKACDMVLHDNTKMLFQSLEGINRIIDDALFKDEGFRLRAENIKQRNQLYSNRLFLYDYVVLNFYSSEVPTIHATEEAYEQLKKIIVKESGM